MISLFECGTVDEGQTDGLLIDKVVWLEMFGGLKFVSKHYFHFVLRLEYVFFRCLTSVNLAILGKLVIQRVYDSLREIRD